MFVLSRQELIEWSGYRQPTRVAAWLRQNGIKHLIGADGWPRVVREHGKVASTTLMPSLPNVAALKELQHGKAKKTQTRSA